MNTSLILRLAALPLVMALGSCGRDESLNRFVKAGMTPTSPKIILADTKTGNGDDAEDIEAPWFLASFTIVNQNTDFNLLIPSIKFEYSYTKNGVTETGTSTLTADDICDDGDVRTLYADMLPNTTFQGDLDCDGNYGTTADKEFVFLHGLPADDADNPTVRNYRVKVTFEGYFYDRNDEEFVKDRVEVVRYYTTQ